MLQVQVAYWTLMENVRHNKAQEGIATDTLSETIRHNKISEKQGQESINQGWSNLGATLARNQIELKKTQLQSRANDIAYMNAVSNASNAATNRYKAETERSLGYGNLAVSRQNAQSQSIQAASAAQQARNSADANVIRSQELNVAKYNALAGAMNNWMGNLVRIGGMMK